MNDPNPLAEQDLQDVAAYADGTLVGERRAALEARLSSEPQLAAELTRQQRALAAVVAAQREVGAPNRLRQAVGAERARRRPLFATRRRFGFAAGGAALAAVALVVLFVVLPGGFDGERAIANAAATHSAPAEAGPPAERTPTLLDAEGFGVTFPAWRTKFGWVTVGTRTDRVEGRDVQTVLYRKGANTVGYSVIDGNPIDPPDDVTVAVHEGNAVSVYEEQGRTIAVFRRAGRTCVVSATGVDRATLIELAGWTGKGTVPFG